MQLSTSKHDRLADSFLDNDISKATTYSVQATRLYLFFVWSILLHHIYDIQCWHTGHEIAVPVSPQREKSLFAIGFLCFFLQLQFS